MGIGSIARIASKGWNYAGRLIFDDRFATEVTSSLKNSGNYYKRAGKGRFFQFDKQIGRAFQKADKYTSNKKIFQSLKDSLKSYKTDVSALWKSDKKFLSKIGGTLKGLGKRAPLLGTALMVAFELPNIIKATLNEGLVQGAAETVKAGARLAGGTLLGAIGTAIGGPIGGIVGFILGDWVTSKIVGKSYSERKYDEKQKLAEQTAQQAVQTTAPVTSPYGYQTQGFNPAMYQQMLYGGYDDDFMYNAINKQPQFNIQA